jgi:hypothetical protein
MMIFQESRKDTVFLCLSLLDAAQYLTQVASYKKAPLFKYKVLNLGAYQYAKTVILYRFDTIKGY